MFGIGGWELLLIFVIILLLFGAKRLPEIARSLGKSVNEFKKTKDDFMDYAESEKKEDKEKKAEDEKELPEEYKKPDEDEK